MTKLPQPILIARRRIRVTLALSAIVLAATGWWGFVPVEIADVPTLELTTTEAQKYEIQNEPLDIAAFDAMIWRIPDKPDRVVAQQPTNTTVARKPLTFELIATTADVQDGVRVRRAALYDTATMNLALFEEGDNAGGWLIASIETGEVVLRDGTHSAKLALRRDAPPLRLGRAGR